MILVIVAGCAAAGLLAAVCVPTLRRRRGAIRPVDRIARDTWRMPPVATLERPAMSTSRRIGLGMPRLYRVAAIVLVIIKVVEGGVEPLSLAGVRRQTAITIAIDVSLSMQPAEWRRPALVRRSRPRRRSSPCCRTRTTSAWCPSPGPPTCATGSAAVGALFATYSFTTLLRRPSNQP
jgi:hypothetical protein